MLPRAEINVTPMIDVMLVLLIIFMIVTPAISRRVLLPTADHADSQPEQPREVILNIDGTGRLSLTTTGAGTTEEHAPSLDALRERLVTLYAHRTQDRILYLKADSALAFRTIDEAIAVARGAGVRVIATVTEPRWRAHQ